MFSISLRTPRFILLKRKTLIKVEAIKNHQRRKREFSIDKKHEH